MKKLVASITALALLGVVMTPAVAAPRKTITVVQPSPLSCIVVPFPGTGCPLGERILGSVLWIGAIGAGVGAIAAGGALGAAAVPHAVATGTAVGAGVGVVAPLVVH